MTVPCEQKIEQLHWESLGNYQLNEKNLLSYLLHFTRIIQLDFKLKKQMISEVRFNDKKIFFFDLQDIELQIWSQDKQDRMSNAIITRINTKLSFENTHDHIIPFKVNGQTYKERQR